MAYQGVILLYPIIIAANMADLRIRQDLLMKQAAAAHHHHQQQQQQQQQGSHKHGYQGPSQVVSFILLSEEVTG